MTNWKGLIVLLAGVALVTGLAAPATAGDPDVTLKIAKQEGGPYEQLGVRLNIAAGEKRNVSLKARSVTGDVEPVLLDDEFSLYPVNWLVQYFTKNGTDITPQVKGAGFAFNAKPDKAKLFRVKIKVFGSGFGCVTSRVIHAGPDDFAFAAVNVPKQSCVV
jgi:hypothetical protein